MRNVSLNAQITGLYKGNYKHLGILLLGNKTSPQTARISKVSLQKY